MTYNLGQLSVSFLQSLTPVATMTSPAKEAIKQTKARIKGIMSYVPMLPHRRLSPAVTRKFFPWLPACTPLKGTRFQICPDDPFLYKSPGTGNYGNQESHPPAQITEFNRSSSIRNSRDLFFLLPLFVIST